MECNPERADLIDKGVVEAAVVVSDRTGGTDPQALLDCGALRVLKLNRQFSDPGPQFADVIERLQVLGADDLVLVVREVGELDSEPAVAAGALRH